MLKAAILKKQAFLKVMDKTLTPNGLTKSTTLKWTTPKKYYFR